MVDDISCRRGCHGSATSRGKVIPVAADGVFFPALLWPFAALDATVLRKCPRIGRPMLMSVLDVLLWMTGRQVRPSVEVALWRDSVAHGIFQSFSDRLISAQHLDVSPHGLIYTNEDRPTKPGRPNEEREHTRFSTTAKP